MRPRFRSRIIWRTEVVHIWPSEQSRYATGWDTFAPIFDTTDHLGFGCKQCQCPARIIRVEAVGTATLEPKLFWYIRCPKCQKEAMLKMYLNQNVPFQCLAKLGELLPLEELKAKMP